VHAHIAHCAQHSSRYSSQYSLIYPICITDAISLHNMAGLYQEVSDEAFVNHLSDLLFESGYDQNAQK
jgi:hypothetical protein